MKTGTKKLTKGLAALGLTAILALQGIWPSNMSFAVFAAETDNGQAGETAADTDSNSLVEALLTSYRPQVKEYTDPYSGFTHPGVGVTKEILDNVQAQVRAGAEPWKSYFETMLLDNWVSGKEVGPARKGGGFNNGQFANEGDGARAYAQALMYYITGDNAYRRNAMRIIRAYEDIDPESLEYFNDACIHTGIPTNRICIAAEILRCSTYEVTEGYTEEELAWTDEDTEKFITNKPGSGSIPVQPRPFYEPASLYHHRRHVRLSVHG